MKLDMWLCVFCIFLMGQKEFCVKMWNFGFESLKIVKFFSDIYFHVLMHFVTRFFSLIILIFY